MAAETPPVDSPETPRSYPTKETRRKARIDYVQGRGSLTALGKKYGVSLFTMKNWAKREQWQELRSAFDIRALEDTLPATPPAAAPMPALTPQAARLARVEKELERLEIAMDKAHSDDGTANAATLRDLSASHSRLFDVWCTLTGTPRPGVRKTVKPGRSLAPIVAPTESTAQAVEPQKLGE